MTNTIGVITSTITAEALWGAITPVVPFALTVTIFALGFYLVRRQLKKVSKAKGGM